MNERRTFLLIATVALLLGALMCKDSAPAGDDDDGNTETGEDLDPDDIVEVQIRPTVVRIDTATEIDLKAHAIARDGAWYDTVGGTWHGTNDAVATVDADGHLVPVATGQLLVEYRWEGVAADPATVEIVDPGTLDVEVVDWVSGEPVVGCNLGLGNDGVIELQDVTDAEGRVSFSGDFAGPVTLTAWCDGGYRYQSLAHVAPRQIRMPLVPSETALGQGRMQGTLTFDEEDLTAGKVAVAMAVPSTDENPIQITARDLLGVNRDLTGYNLEWTIPENVQINGIADDFEGDILPGRRVVSGAGGVYDLSVALELALALEEYGTGAVFPVMTSHIEDLRFGVSEPLDVGENAEITGLSFPVTTELPLHSDVDVAAPPAGYHWPDPILVLSWRPYQDYGYVAVGFGTGDHPYLPDDEEPTDDDSADDDDATWTAVRSELEERVWIHVREVARDGVFEDVPTIHYAFISEGGTDYGGRGTAVVSPPTLEEKVRLPEFLSLIDYVEPEDGSWRFDWTPPEGADITWLLTYPRCCDDDIGGWWVFGPAMSEFEYPRTLPLLTPEGDCIDDDGEEHVKRTTFEPEVMGLERVSYLSLVNLHDEDLTAVWTYSNRRTYATVKAYHADFP